jgi:hypothetical protein
MKLIALALRSTVFAAATGLVTISGGALRAIWRIGAFVVPGLGTPAVFDAPTRLVAAGPFHREYCRRTPRWLPRIHRASPAGFVALLVCCTLFGADTKPDFTGEWRLNRDRSDFGLVPGPDRRTDVIRHSLSKLHLESKQARGQRESTGEWDCVIDGSPCTVTLRGPALRLATRVRWDGAVLVFESEGELNGEQVRMSDRWTLSADGKEITIARRLSSPAGETHQTLVLEKQ